MRENFTYGSVRGAAGDGSPYRDSTTTSLDLQMERSTRLGDVHRTAFLQKRCGTAA